MRKYCIALVLLTNPLSIYNYYSFLKYFTSYCHRIQNSSTGSSDVFKLMLTFKSLKHLKPKLASLTILRYRTLKSNEKPCLLHFWVVGIFSKFSVHMYVWSIAAKITMTSFICYTKFILIF